MIKEIWNLIKNYINNLLDSSIATQPELNIELKSNIKEGIKEALDEILTELTEDNSDYNTQFYLKQLALASSVLFISYFIFYLPGSVSQEELIQYNYLNQSLIEFKVYIINFFNTPATGGANPPIVGGSEAAGVEIVTPENVSPTYSDYFAEANSPTGSDVTIMK